MPGGYRADRLNAAAERRLTVLELLEVGVPDAVGALEVCENIDAKLQWVAHEFSRLSDIILTLQTDAPASRAIRQLNDDASTSAGGERPKVTIRDQGRLWLVKMQDRSDISFLPAKEFVCMRLAQEAGIHAAESRLESVGHHQVFLSARFDRGGDPKKPTRKLFASAHTVLGLSLSAVMGNALRSYLSLADEMRVWCRGSPRLQADLRDLWMRMVFNGLVGNSDDHPRNHGLLFDEGHWGLAPAFDITPSDYFKRVLAMSTASDGSSSASAQSFLACCERFEWGVEDAARWLKWASKLVAHEWAPRLRACGVAEASIEAAKPAFALSAELASDDRVIEFAAEACLAKPTRSRTARRPR